MPEFRLYGPASPLRDALAQALELPVGAATIGAFADGERHVTLADLRPGTGAILVISTGPPVDSHVMTLALAADAARRAGAAEILGVVPYFGYGRGDRVAEPGAAISAAVVARLFEEAGLTRLVTLDLHNPAIAGFFRIPVVAGSAVAQFAERLAAGGSSARRVVVAPDAGGIGRASRLAALLGAPLAIALKQRTAPDTPKILALWGDVAGREAIVVDDMVTTGATLAGVCRLLWDRGAAAVHVAATHAVMAPGAEQLLRESHVGRVLFTDTVPFEPSAAGPAVEILPAAPLLADLVRPLVGGGQSRRQQAGSV